MSIKTQDIARDGLYGYLAQPETAGKGSVLIVPTIFGVNPFVRGYADTLARAGLTAAVCDLYSGAAAAGQLRGSAGAGAQARRCHGR